MGAYDNYLSGSLRENYLAFLQQQDSLDLSNELAVLRSLFGEALQDKNFKAIPGIVGEIRQLSNTIARNIENSRLYLPISMLAFVVQQINAIIRREVKDPDAVRRISNALGSISLPADRRELDSLRRAVQTGKLPVPHTGGVPPVDQAAPL